MNYTDQHNEEFCPSGENLAAYAKGTADPVITRQIETHLLDCSLCDSAIEGLRNHPSISKTQLHQMTQNIVANNMDELDAPRRDRRLIIKLAAAAVLLGFLFLGWYKYHQAQAPDRVFAEFFDPAPRVAFSGQRAISAARRDDPVLTQAIRYHLAGAYEFALSSWRSYLEDNAKPDPKAYLYAANAAMATGKYDLAKHFLDELPPSSSEILGEETAWYRTLHTLKTQGVASAIAQIDEVDASLTSDVNQQRLSDLRQRLLGLVSTDG